MGKLAEEDVTEMKAATCIFNRIWPKLTLAFPTSLLQILTLDNGLVSDALVRAFLCWLSKTDYFLVNSEMAIKHKK